MQVLTFSGEGEHRNNGDDGVDIGASGDGADIVVSLDCAANDEFETSA